MRILVTGASGFIGRRVVADLVRMGLHVETLHRGDPIDALESEHTRADVCSAVARAAVSGVHAVVHLAGNGDVQESFSQPFESNRLNAVGTLNVLEGARKRGVHVVLASTQRVYKASSKPFSEDDPTQPTDPYAVAKFVAEQWCRMYAEMLGVPTTVVRLFTVYGPGQVGKGTSGVVGIFLERAMRGKPLDVHADQRRDMTHVNDVAHGIRLTIERPPRSNEARVYNLATGVGTSLEELARLACRVAGSSSKVMPPKELSAEGDRIADISRARRELGYEPAVPVEVGIRQTAEWLRTAGTSGSTHP